MPRGLQVEGVEQLRILAARRDHHVVRVGGIVPAGGDWTSVLTDPETTDESLPCNIRSSWVPQMRIVFCDVVSNAMICARIECKPGSLLLRRCTLSRGTSRYGTGARQRTEVCFIGVTSWLFEIVS